MSYVAVTYVGKWTPGEIITDELTDEQAARLLKKGAVKLMVNVIQQPEPCQPEPKAAAEEKQEQPAEEAEAPLEIDAADALVTTPKPKRTTKARTRK